MDNTLMYGISHLPVDWKTKGNNFLETRHSSTLQCLKTRNKYSSRSQILEHRKSWKLHVQITTENTKQKTRTPMNALAPFFGHLICETDCLTWWTRTILVTSQEGIAWNRAEPTDATILDPDGPWSNYTKTKKNLNPKTKTSCHGAFWWVMGMMRSEFHHRFHGFRDFLELSPASSHLSGNGDGQSNCGNINPIW